MNQAHKQPNVLKILLTAEFAERFSFWGLQSLLVLYLTRVISLPLNLAYLTYGTCTALTFALSVLGGILADKLLGFRRALIVGVSLSIIGNLVLIIPHTSTLYVGLALVICGTALFTPNNSNLLGTFYDQNHPHRNKGFYLLYMGTNSGGLFGPIIYGIVAIKYGWHYSFIFSAVILGSWLSWFIVQKKQFLNNGAPPYYATHQSYTFIKKHYKLFLYASLCFIIATVWLLIQHTKFASTVLGLTGLITVSGLFLAATKYDQSARNGILCLMAMMLVCLLFFAIEFQVNSSLILFADQYVDRHLFNWEIPSTAFAAFEPLSIIILAPLFAFLLPLLGKRTPSAVTMLVLCIILESASFYIFYLLSHSITETTQKASLMWMLGGNFLLGAGEVCLMPTLISSITKLAPKRLKGTLMGTLYLAIAFSSYASGLIAAATTQNQLHKKIVLPSDYMHVYLNIAQLTFSLALIGLFGYLLIKFFMSRYKNTKTV